MPDIQNYTLNFGPQHPAAHGVLRMVPSWMVRLFSARSAHRHVAPRDGETPRRPRLGSSLFFTWIA